MNGHMGQQTNYSLMNEVDETERNVSIQIEDRQAEQWGELVCLFVCMLAG